MTLQDDSAAIERVHDDWLALERRGDSRGLLELCVPDPVWLPPDAGPLCGRAAILAWIDRQPASALVRIDIDDLTVRSHGAFAWKAARFRTTFESPPGSGLRAAAGAHAWLLRRTGTGVWKVAVVAWTIQADGADG
jgi:uncharacterized protein (TIGR02246 family)